MVNAVMTAQPASDLGPFEKFLQWLSADREQALKKHDQIRKKITKYLVRKGCPDSEELFDETRDRVIEIVNSGQEYDNADALFYSVARNVWLEEQRKIKPEPLAEDIPGSSWETENKELTAGCLETCLGKLRAGERKFIVQYYEGQGQGKIEGRKQMAGAHGGDNIVRIKAFRIRAKLRTCITDCVNQSMS
jgi:hypothetical protein